MTLRDTLTEQRGQLLAVHAALKAVEGRLDSSGSAGQHVHLAYFHVWRAVTQLDLVLAGNIHAGAVEPQP